MKWINNEERYLDRQNTFSIWINNECCVLSNTLSDALSNALRSAVRQLQSAWVVQNRQDQREISFIISGVSEKKSQLKDFSANFKRPKNREDGSDFDDFWTKSIASTQTKIWKIFPRRRRRRRGRRSSPPSSSSSSPNGNRNVLK